MTAELFLTNVRFSKNQLKWLLTCMQNAYEPRVSHHRHKEFVDAIRGTVNVS